MPRSSWEKQGKKQYIWEKGCSGGFGEDGNKGSGATSKTPFQVKPNRPKKEYPRGGKEREKKPSMKFHWSCLFNGQNDADRVVSHKNRVGKSVEEGNKSKAS